MITRMTVTSSKQVTKEFNDKAQLPAEVQMRSIIDEAKNLAIFYFNCSTMFDYLLLNPKADIKEAYRSFFTGGENVTVRKITTTLRTYNYKGCVITENDTINDNQ